MKRFVWLLCAILPAMQDCTKHVTSFYVSGNNLSAILIPPGRDIADFIGTHPQKNEFLLATGQYPAGQGTCITRSHIIIRSKSPGDQPRITDPMQFCGDNNVIDGLTWDADKDPGIRMSDPGTLCLSGKRNIVRNCVFRNFRTTVNGDVIVMLGRLFTGSIFINTVADCNTIESCVFDNWGLRGEPHNSVKSSTCIAVGLENDKGRFTGTVIRKNLFINGPYREYGYNAACKVFNAVLLEDNTFFGGQECMEMKFGNSTVRGNIIHHFSGYNILANRYGKNSLYEYNTVYDVAPFDGVSSSQGLMIWECGNTVLRNNLIYDCQTTGLIPGRQTLQNTLLEYLLIENNSFINNKRGIVFENETGSPRQVFITRNIFYHGAGAAVYALSNVDTASLAYYADNLYYDGFTERGDRAPVIANPQFVNPAGQNFLLSSQSPACGYGAFPCGTANAGSGEPPDDPARHVVIYPTKDKWVFHVGLVGLDIRPLRLEVVDGAGKELAIRNVPDPGYKLFSNIDLRASQPRDIVIRLNTDKTVITKYVHIE
ncbi:right-handed parallel beta-helix repeat-containing protein [Puia dinghuensis]|uniref:Right handed beta helix domain-containing protein n=1 Tax=Puia dinghuensis TaxID=1792502 RepID=A0A8J2UEH2_9BACT|nr:right-handed parallel beta-helix repeat-containing protein [Puia dinghuensis]GGB06374.1 hypothetical protein GCM10011511_32240 [Puia dinghuensis]